MRASLVLALCFALPAFGQSTPGAPRSIGKFGEWQAALRPEPDGITCFAFTRPEAGAQHGAGRGNAVLSVTRRPRSHDVVAVSAGFMLSGREDAQLRAGDTRMLFYIANRNAFARDNAAAIAIFAHESSVMAWLPGPHGVAATERFSLAGFSAALDAMRKACAR